MPEIRTLKKTTWEEIKINEVFAFKGCWCILIKTNENHAKLISADNEFLQKDYIGTTYDFKTMEHIVNCFVGNSYFIKGIGINKFEDTGILSSTSMSKNNSPIYKLPVAMQRLWLEE